MGSVHDFYHGASMYAWIHQHTFGHHQYTNIDGADPDIVTAAQVRCGGNCDSVLMVHYMHILGHKENQVEPDLVASLLFPACVYAHSVLCCKFITIHTLSSLASNPNLFSSPAWGQD